MEEEEEVLKKKGFNIIREGTMGGGDSCLFEYKLYQLFFLSPTITFKLLVLSPTCDVIHLHAGQWPREFDVEETADELVRSRNPS